MSKRNLAKEERLAKSVRSWLDKRVRAANEHGKAVQTTDTGDRLWSERTIRDVYNMKFMELGAAKERAEQMADAGPKLLGVVAVVNRIEDHSKWEEMAKAIEAGKPVIDVEAVSELPQKDVHGTRGAIGGVSAELGSRVPEQAKAGKADQEGQDDKVGGEAA